MRRGHGCAVPAPRVKGTGFIVYYDSALCILYCECFIIVYSIVCMLSFCDYVLCMLYYCHFCVFYIVHALLYEVTGAPRAILGLRVQGAL